MSRDDAGMTRSAEMTQFAEMTQPSGSGDPDPDRAIAAMVAQLRAMIEHARAMPLSSSAVINRTEVLAAIDLIEASLPRAFAESNRVYAQRDEVLARARRDAERIIVEASVEREKMMSDSDVYKVSTTKLAALEEQARRERDELRRETDEYVDGRLAQLEVELTRTLDALARGRARLQGRSALGSIEDDGKAFEYPR